MEQKEQDKTGSAGPLDNIVHVQDAASEILWLFNITKCLLALHDDMVGVQHNYWALDLYVAAMAGGRGHGRM